MSDDDRLNRIAVQYKDNLGSVGEDIRFLLEKVRILQKKSEVLAQQNLELSAEIENVRADFGDQR